MISWFNLALILIVTSAGGLALFRWYALARGLLDKPNSRSSHTINTPRGGGIIFSSLWLLFLGLLVYFSDIEDKPHWHFYLAAFAPVTLIILMGFIDDAKGLSAKSRFIGQMIAASVSLCVIGGADELFQLSTELPKWIIFPLSMIGMTWIVNLVNFMDGADGVAATEGIFVLGVGGYILQQSGAFELATLSWGLVFLLLGFLVWNLPTAKIFMGDSGSCFLGFVIGLMALIGQLWFQISLYYWMILTAVFWFDATITLLRRIINRDNWLSGHKEHAYQRMIQYGWSHRKVLSGLIVINSFLSSLALWAFHDPKLLKVALGLAIGFISFIYIMIELTRPMYKTWHQT